MFYQNYQRPAIGAILDQTPHDPTDRGSSISVSTGSQLVVALSKEKPTEVLVEVSVITKKLSKAFQAASSSHWKLMAREKFNKAELFWQSHTIRILRTRASFKGASMRNLLLRQDTFKQERIHSMPALKRSHSNEDKRKKC